MNARQRDRQDAERTSATVAHFFAFVLSIARFSQPVVALSIRGNLACTHEPSNKNSISNKTNEKLGTISSFGIFFWIFFFLGGLVLADWPPHPPLECNSTLPLVTAVFITPKGAQSPGSRRIGVIGALVLILPSETV